MRFGWESDKEKIIRGSKIPAAEKLKALRLMNELTDKALTPHQKILRRRLKENR